MTVSNGNPEFTALAYVGAYSDVYIRGGNWRGRIQIKQMSVGGMIRELSGVTVTGHRDVDFYYARFIAQGCRVIGNHFQNVGSAIRGRLVQCNIEWNTFIDSRTSLYLDRDVSNANNKCEDVSIANNTFERLASGITRRDGVPRDPKGVVLENSVFRGKFTTILDTSSDAMVWRNNRADVATWNAVVTEGSPSYRAVDSLLKSVDDVPFSPKCEKYVISSEDAAFRVAANTTQVTLHSVVQSQPIVSAAMRPVTTFSDGDGPMVDVSLWIGGSRGPSQDAILQSVGEATFGGNVVLLPTDQLGLGRGEVIDLVVRLQSSGRDFGDGTSTFLTDGRVDMVVCRSSQ